MVEYKIDCRSDNTSTFELSKNKIQASHKFKFAYVEKLAKPAEPEVLPRWLCFFWQPNSLQQSNQITTSLDVRLDPSHLQLLSISMNATFVSNVSVIKATVCPRWSSLNALNVQIIVGGKVWTNMYRYCLAGWRRPQWQAYGEGKEEPCGFCDNFPQKEKIISAKREVTWQFSTFDRHIKLQTGLKSSNGFFCHILHQAKSEAVGLIFFFKYTEEYL